MPKYKPQPQTHESVANLARALAASVERLQALSATMKADDLNSLEVTHYDQMNRGLEYIDNFAGALATAIRKAKIERGDFVGSNGAKKSLPRKKKPG